MMEKGCGHKRTGTRFLFTPAKAKKVVALTYCKDCGKELSREPVSTATADSRGKREKE